MARVMSVCTGFNKGIGLLERRLNGKLTQPQV